MNSEGSNERLDELINAWKDVDIPLVQKIPSYILLCPGKNLRYWKERLGFTSKNELQIKTAFKKLSKEKIIVALGPRSKAVYSLSEAGEHKVNFYNLNFYLLTRCKEKAATELWDYLQLIFLEFSPLLMCNPESLSEFTKICKNADEIDVKRHVDFFIKRYQDMNTKYEEERDPRTAVRIYEFLLSKYKKIYESKDGNTEWIDTIQNEYQITKNDHYRYCQFAHACRELIENKPINLIRLVQELERDKVKYELKLEHARKNSQIALKRQKKRAAIREARKELFDKLTIYLNENTGLVYKKFNDFIAKNTTLVVGLGFSKGRQLQLWYNAERRKINKR